MCACGTRSMLVGRGKSAACIQWMLGRRDIINQWLCAGQGGGCGRAAVEEEACGGAGAARVPHRGRVLAEAAERPQEAPKQTILDMRGPQARLPPRTHPSAACVAP